MKSLSASSLHPNLQRSTERKAPHRAAEESTERHARKLQELKTKLLQRKRGVPNEEAAAKADIKSAITQAKLYMNDLENELIQQAGTASLRLLEQIDRQLSDRHPEEEDIEKLTEYRIQLSVEGEDFKEQVMGLLEVLPVPGEQPKSSRMNRRKYQEIIDRMQAKLEKCLINEQRLLEEKKQWERKAERAYKQPRQSVLGERYQRENQILIEENLKLANKSLQMVSENSSLKEKLRQSQQQIECITSQLMKSSSTVEKLQSKLNQPDRKILEDNRRLQQIVQQFKSNLSSCQQRVSALEQQLSQATSRIYSSSAELDCSRRQIQQLRQQLQSYSVKSAQDQNKYLHLESVYKTILEEKEDLSRDLAQQFMEINNIRKSESESALQNKKLKEDIATLKDQIEELNEKNSRLERSIEKQVEQSQDEQMQLIRQAQNRESLQKDKYLLTERLANMQGLLEAIRKDKISAIEQCRKLQQVNANLRTENLQLLSQNKNKEAELDRLLHQIQDMKLEISVKANKIESTKKKQQQNKKFAEQKAELQQSYAVKLETLYRDISSARIDIENIRQNYENRRKLQETRLKIIKEKFVQQVLSAIEKGKNKKQEAIQIIQRLVDSFSNLSHKQSIITRLKEQKGQLSREISDLKTKLSKIEESKMKKTDSKQQTAAKPKVQKRILEAQSDIRQFTNELIAQKAKIQKGNAEEKLKVADQTISSMESYIRRMQQERDLFEKTQTELQNRIKQLERRNKIDRAEEHFKSVQQSIQTQHEQLKKDISLVRGELEDIRKDRDELRQDIKYKKDYINTLKKDMKELQTKLKNINIELEQQKQEHSKTKKMVKEFQRKEQVVKDNRQKIEASRTLEKQNAELKRIIEERAKQYKTELSKRDNTIKILKERELCSESLMRESQNDINNTHMLEQQLNSQIRKAKSEIDRKDTLIKTLKERLQKAEQTLEKQRKQAQKKGQKDRIDIDREVKKGEQLKLQIKKLDSQLFSFRTLLKKLGKLLLEQNKSTQKTFSSIKPSEISLYEQGLSILQIKPDDLKDFLPEAQKQNKNTSNLQINQLQKVLSKEQFDPSAVFSVLADLIQFSCSRHH